MPGSRFGGCGRPQKRSRRRPASIAQGITANNTPGLDGQIHAGVNLTGTAFVNDRSRCRAARVLPIDEGLARRLKALACTAPLHDLDARKTRLDWADAADYQMAEIALQAIDQVTIAMDFDRGANHDQVVARLRPFIHAQLPDRGADEHDQVARWVLDNLINVGSMDRGFHAVYGTFGDTGLAERTARIRLQAADRTRAGPGWRSVPARHR